jgi:endoglucanase
MVHLARSVCGVLNDKEATMTNWVSVLVLLGVFIGMGLAIPGCGSVSPPVQPNGRDTGERSTIRVNAGAAQAITDESGNHWEADSGFWGGGVANRGEIPIADTPTPSIYRTERWGHTEFRRQLPDGRYLVRLHFAETYDGTMREGLRQMIVDVNGQTSDRFDVYAITGGKFKAMVKEFDIRVTDGNLLVRFAGAPGTHHATMINGIEMIPQ